MYALTNVLSVCASSSTKADGGHKSLLPLSASILATQQSFYELFVMSQEALILLLD